MTSTGPCASTPRSILPGLSWDQSIAFDSLITGAATFLYRGGACSFSRAPEGPYLFEISHIKPRYLLSAWMPQTPQSLAGFGFELATLMGLEPTTSCVTDS